MRKYAKKLKLVWEEDKTKDVTDLDLCDSDEAANHFRNLIGNAPNEQFAVVAMSAAMEYIGESVINSGISTASIVDIGLLLRTILASGGDMVLVSHQHPTGDPQPSDADHKMTQALIRCCALVRVALVDHIIVGGSRYYSFYSENPEYWDLSE